MNLCIYSLEKSSSGDGGNVSSNVPGLADEFNIGYGQELATVVMDGTDTTDRTIGSRRRNSRFTIG